VGALLALSPVIPPREADWPSALDMGRSGSGTFRK
jgi:hypothetical protein